MGYICKITGESSAGTITYDENSAFTGRLLRAFDAGDVIADIYKFRVPGVDGSYIMRNGLVGHKISIGVRYINTTLDSLEAWILADQLMFSTEACTILHLGQSYYGCNLIPGSWRRVSPVLNTGRGGVYTDISMKFSEDLPSPSSASSSSA